MAHLIYTREALFDLVWEQPVTKLAKDLGLSDVGLSKACRRADIPLPERGHWARLLAGKTVVRPPLPMRGLGKPEEIEFGGSRYGREMPTEAEILSMDIPPPPVFFEDLDEVKARARGMVKRIVIPRRLDRCHPEIAKLLRADEERVAKQLKYSYSWDQPIFGSIVERRRLRFLNALLLSLTVCGCKCGISGKEARGAYVKVGEESISFSFEHVGAKERQYNERPNPIPEGAKLSLKLNWWQPPPELEIQWEDTTEHTIEDRITEIGIALLVAGEWAYRSWLIRRRKYIIERRDELQEEARQAKLELERKERDRLALVAKGKRDRLLADARAWRDAANIRAFVNAAKSTNNEIEDTWVEWALQEADRLDPLVAAQHSR